MHARARARAPERVMHVHARTCRRCHMQPRAAPMRAALQARTRHVHMRAPTPRRTPHRPALRHIKVGPPSRPPARRPAQPYTRLHRPLRAELHRIPPCRAAEPDEPVWDTAFRLTTRNDRRGLAQFLDRHELAEHAEMPERGSSFTEHRGARRRRVPKVRAERNSSDASHRRPFRCYPRIRPCPRCSPSAFFEEEKNEDPLSQSSGVVRARRRRSSTSQLTSTL